VVAPGTLFALMAGIYYWYPKATGRYMNETLGKIHFWISLVCMNGVFMPMMIQGMAGMQRRLWDGGESYAHTQDVLDLHRLISFSAWGLAIGQLPFIVNFFLSLRRGRKATSNAWEATTLEWAAPSPPPHGNFLTEPAAYRDPYEYSAPGAAGGFAPQWEPEPETPSAAPGAEPAAQPAG
jgi:cytochrome c oxidase subunit 1